MANLAGFLFACIVAITLVLTVTFRDDIRAAWAQYKREKNGEPAPQHYIPASCKGEYCYCGKPAEHKVEEVIFSDDPTGSGVVTVGGHTFQSQFRHPLARYVCHQHFVEIMGPLAKRVGE